MNVFQTLIFPDFVFSKLLSELQSTVFCLLLLLREGTFFSLSRNKTAAYAL